MELKGLRAAFHTLGCKVNIYETEVMESLLREAGMILVPFGEKADVYIVNTCTVTNIADRKSRQMLHRAGKENPDAVIVSCGCFSQISGPGKKEETGADLLIGTDQKGDIVRILSEYLEEKKENVPSDVSVPGVFKKMTLTALTEHSRADIKVQDGCNQFCTYCIIPYARGRIRSKRPEDAEEEIRLLSEKGVREFVLTGIHLSSYGKDLPEKTGLLDLISRIHALPGVERIRLGSLEPRIVTEEFAKALSEFPKICPHFHLSLQSGSASVLKRMNRHYTPEEYRKSCELLRKYFDDPAITTDVICGFPGETDAEFSESLKFVREIGFYELHVFQYSRRKGTVADRMPDQVPDEVKKKRSEEMLLTGAEMSGEYRARQLGRVREVLTEEKKIIGGKTYYIGYTKEYVKAAVQESVGGNRVVRGKLEGFLSGDTLFMSLDT